MHVFLTGLRGIGKTTVIERVVNGALSGGTVSADEITGFRTVWMRSRETGSASEALYILPYKAESPVPRAGARPVAERDAENQTLMIHPEVFDEDGVAILRAATEGATPPKIIIMDELGYMESDSPAFRRAVADKLDGGVPVLGVMRWERNPFLNAVGTHEKVEVVEVSESNRDALPERLTEQLFHD
ncbi:MAG: nucleoside-triphosphatase [Clostridiales Family XIII bacterium]|jgi:nucleoside-triphosphatase THEP1|nr:nucleoside-triphosphatase [Clostridiales Family XIII bacterium]